VRTRLRRGALDEQLARGADPETSPDLSLRAASLRSADGRSELANGLVEHLGDARGPNLGAFSTKSRRRDAAIVEAAEALLAVVARLRDEGPVEVRGVAMVALLLNDRGSALHGGRAVELREALTAAHEALGPVRQPAEGLTAAA
jgi:hypothetical protein